MELVPAICEIVCVSSPDREVGGLRDDFLRFRYGVSKARSTMRAWKNSSIVGCTTERTVTPSPGLSFANDGAAASESAIAVVSDSSFMVILLLVDRC